jgi:hypothetical protein
MRNMAIAGNSRTEDWTTAEVEVVVQRAQPTPELQATPGLEADSGPPDRIALGLVVKTVEQDDDELLILELKSEVSALEVESVELEPAADPTSASRSVELAMLGQLLVTLTNSPELLRSVIGVVQTWLGRHQGHTVEMHIGSDSLKLSAASAEQQLELVELFVRMHSGADQVPAVDQASGFR